MAGVLIRFATAWPAAVVGSCSDFATACDGWFSQQAILRYSMP